MKEGMQITQSQMDQVLYDLSSVNRYKEENVAIYTKDGQTQLKVIKDDKGVKVFAYNKAKKIINQMANA